MSSRFDEKMKEYNSALTDGRVMSLELLLKVMKLNDVTELHEAEELIKILLESAKDGRNE